MPRHAADVGILSLAQNDVPFNITTRSGKGLLFQIGLVCLELSRPPQLNQQEDTWEQFKEKEARLLAHPWQYAL